MILSRRVFFQGVYLCLSFLATDYATQISLFTHHMWIGGFCIVGAAAHAAIVRELYFVLNFCFVFII